MSREPRHETLAFHDKVQASLAERGLQAEIEVEARYDRVRCSAGARSVDVSCFEGGELLASFHDDERRAAACTCDRDRLGLAIAAWLSGDSVEALRDGFDFVDRALRQLEFIQAELLLRFPGFETRVEQVLRVQYIDSCALVASAQERGCRIYFYGREALPRFEFYWGGAHHFTVQREGLDQNLLLVFRWLHDQAAPSALEAELPWLETGELARYYEAGRGVEGEFVLSWKWIRDFFADFKYAYVPEVLDFIDAICAAGFDKNLRAGQSLDILMVSRSRHHGLRPEQPYIAFHFSAQGMRVEVSLAKAKQQLLLDKIGMRDEVTVLLRQLENEEVT